MMIWIQNGDVVKGEINYATGTVKFFDKFNNILMIRQGLSTTQLKEIHRQCQKQLATRKQVGFYYV